jgi:hypothetical protein
MTRAETALIALVEALDALVAALQQTGADAVLRVEPRLDVAVAELRAVLGAVTPETLGTPGRVRSLVRQAQDRIAHARRLGGTVPALLSVMFPGQVSYSRGGMRVAPMARSGMTQVI